MSLKFPKLNNPGSILFLLFCVFISCTHVSPSDLSGPENDGSELLNLKWNKAYADDTIDKTAIGLSWALSYVGALLPESPTGMTVGTETIQLDISELGFHPAALRKMQILHQKIKSSDEYQSTQTIDAGRYVSLLIGASEHYYDLTGVPKKLDSLLAQYTLTADSGYVNHSGVSLEHRKIRFSEQKKGNQVFVSSEVDPVSGEIFEYETIEIIPNGQLRFGIFDSAGNRKNHADPNHSNAGKPAKCLWCHESTISRMFNPQDDFPGFLTYQQLQTKLINFNESLTSQRLYLTGGVDFAQTQQHTLTELLYISFMEPSALRLSLEWAMPLTEVQQILAGLPTHIYEEFPFLGDLYHRKDVEDRAPFSGLRVSDRVREASTIEVNHISE